MNLIYVLPKPHTLAVPPQHHAGPASEKKAWYTYLYVVRIGESSLNYYPIMLSPVKDL